MFERIRQLLAENLDIDKESITAESDIVADLGADSLTMVELVFVLEEETGVVIPDDMTDKLFKVGDLAKYVEAHIKKK